MERTHHLVAVMPDRSSADRLADELQRGGVSADRIHVAREVDEVDSLRAEEAAETKDAVIAPQAVFIASKESTRGTVIIGAVATAVALLVAALVALIDVGLTYWARYSIEAPFLVFLVLLIAYPLGGAWAWRTDASLAAERGVVVRVDEATPELAAMIVRAAPIRLDEVTSDGVTVDALHTEGSDADTNMARKAGDTVGHLRRNARSN